MMKGLYSKGVVLLVLGGAGLEAHICQNRGSFLISAIIFSIGFACILVSYKR